MSCGSIRVRPPIHFVSQATSNGTINNKTRKKNIMALNRDSIPITFVAYRNSDLIGSVSLDLSDLPLFDHLSPWLASLYVQTPFRGQGVGRALVHHLQSFALSRGIGRLYLWTAGSTQFYERCGWVEFASATHRSRPIKLMHFSNELGAQARAGIQQPFATSASTSSGSRHATISLHDEQV